MKKANLCQFGKEVKKKLVDIDKTQEWLIAEVKKDTGLFIDSSYLYKIITGKIATPSIVGSICKILELSPPAEDEKASA